MHRLTICAFQYSLSLTMRTPQGAPHWFHQRGLKVRLDIEKSVRGLQVVISASAAILSIVQKWTSSDHSAPTILLSWEIHHSREEMTLGTRVVSEVDLRAMFDCAQSTDGSDPSTCYEWAQHYEGDVGRPGKFLRIKNYLNIPGPGIGRDGDPNISIEIDDEMRRAVCALIEHSS